MRGPGRVVIDHHDGGSVNHLSQLLLRDDFTIRWISSCLITVRSTAI
mgnify:CR=1 FL=1